MASITIECDNCYNREEVSSWEAMNWARACCECTNDACPKCADPNHRDHHVDCWAQTQEPDEDESNANV